VVVLVDGRCLLACLPASLPACPPAGLPRTSRGFWYSALPLVVRLPSLWCHAWPLVVQVNNNGLG